MNKKVFLGGTCNGSGWRDLIIPMLEIDYFNPVVEDWIPECQEQELRERESCNYCLYVITPKMTGVYSIAEVIDDSNKRPEKTVLTILYEDGEESFNVAQQRSLGMVAKMVCNNGSQAFYSLDSTARYINTKACESSGKVYHE